MCIECFPIPQFFNFVRMIISNGAIANCDFLQLIVNPKNSFQPWYYRPSKRMSSHAAITRSTHFMNRMKDRESVGLLHFVSVHTVFGCGCSCCTSIQMAAIWAQSHFNHLPTFFLSFFYLFIFCVCVHSVVLSGMHTHTHTHRTLILKHVVMLFLPARFVFMFMLVIKRFQTWAEWSEWEGARERAKRNSIWNLIFFDKFAISRTFMECLRIQRPYIHLHTHSYMCGKMHLHLFLWATTKNCNLLYLFLLNSGSQPCHAMPCYVMWRGGVAQAHKCV